MSKSNPVLTLPRLGSGVRFASPAPSLPREIRFLGAGPAPTVPDCVPAVMPPGIGVGPNHPRSELWCCSSQLHDRFVDDPEQVGVGLIACAMRAPAGIYVVLRIPRRPDRQHDG